MRKYPNSKFITPSTNTGFSRQQGHPPGHSHKWTLLAA